MILKKKFIITAIVIFSACLLFSGAYVNYTTHSGNLTTDPTISFSNDTPINPNIKPLNLKSQNFQDDWRSQYQGIDQDGNGISDELDAKFKDLEISIFSNQKIGKTPNKKESFLAYQYDNDLNIEEELIRIIVKTSEENLDQVLQIFKEHGGHMKTNFSPFLDAFGGSININRLEPFRETLNQLGFPFFIEEDGKVQAQLYYTGRNMNLRPYVWNTLGYDGDETSAIAIIDTGLDESHPMHSSFINGNYGAKVVGWRDETDNDIQSAPYDDNGHGSHCAGIAAGDGTPTVDGLGRVVVSNTAYEDYTGWYALPQLVSFNFTIFNVTSAGALDVYCSFEDITIPPDYVFGSMYLYHEGSLKASYENNITAWTHTLSYEVPEDELGIYYVQVDLYLVDGDFDGYVYDFGFALRVEPHWFFDEDLMDAGNAWRGIASDTHLVGVKVLDAYGGGWDTDVADGINWVVANKEALNITTISMSLGGAPNSLLIDAVNNAIDAGIVVVAAAGNYGPGGNYIGSPGDADNSICVAAMNYRDEITSYSSQGGYSYTGATIKPDITAPGGSSLALQVFSTDANDNDASGYYTDGYPNDLRGAQGTSMACPAVAGAANLLIEAMGGRPSWSYTADQVKLVKALLLMTATETFPLLREQGSNTTSPVLNRGGKDIHEGYGRINVDIAIEAYTGDLAYGNIISDTISSSVVDPFAKHGFGCHVDLVSGQVYNFNLDVPLGADFDLYLYNDDPTSIGEPILEASSISSVDGEDELLTFVPTETGRYYLVVKAISGSGLANLSIFEIEHDLSVSLGGVPSSYRIGETYSLSAMVTNIGSHDENNVNIGIYIDGVAMNYEVISILPSGNDYTIYYDWTPTVEQFYNISAYALPIPDEYTLQNNLVYEVISIYTFPIPVHRYRFEELAGTVVYDTGNTPVHGTRFNTLIDQPGIDGRSYFFNVSDTISFPPDSSFSFTDQITLSAWIKPVERGAITNSSLYVILGKGFSLTSPTTYDYALFFYPGSYFIFAIADSTGTDFALGLVTTATPTLNEWTMVTGVYTGSPETSRIYFNETEQPLYDAIGLGGNMRDTLSPFHIGHEHEFDTYFTGYIDEVNIFDTALTPDDITELFNIPTTVPGAPQNLQATAGNGHVVLTWEPPATDGGTPITNYLIYRQPSSGGGMVIAIVDDDVLTFTDWNVTNGVTYYYGILAVNDIGYGPVSNIVSATPEEILTVPSAPQNLQATAGDGYVVLTWEPPANDGGTPIINYLIYREDSTGGRKIIAVVDDDVLTFTDEDVENGVTYYYEVIAINDQGFGPASNEASATPEEILTVPSAPQNLQATAGDGHIVLTWEAPADDGGSNILEYRIYRSNIPGEKTLIAILDDVLTFTDANVTNGVTYYYEVIAVNDQGFGPASNEASAIPATIPERPQNLHATRCHEYVILIWEEPSYDGGAEITNYHIYRGTNSGEGILIAIRGDILNFVDVDVKNGVTYYYTVVAVNSQGDSLHSNEVSVSILDPEDPSIPGFDSLFLILGVALMAALIIIKSKTTNRKNLK